MKTKYKFINFEKVSDSGKTSTWDCCNNSSGDCLGVVKWYGPWRQYCFLPYPGCVFSHDCLADIQDFIKQLSNARAAEKVKETK